MPRWQARNLLPVLVPVLVEVSSSVTGNFRKWEKRLFGAKPKNEEMRVGGRELPNAAIYLGQGSSQPADDACQNVRPNYLLTIPEQVFWWMLISTNLESKCFDLEIPITKLSVALGCRFYLDANRQGGKFTCFPLSHNLQTVLVDTPH